GSYRYAMIDLDERRALKKDASKSLHRWLSAWLKTDNPSFITYDRLIPHIWTEKASGAAQRKRLERLRNEVLPEIGQLEGWTVEIGERGEQITHRKAGG